MTVRFPWPVLVAPVRVAFADLRLDDEPTSTVTIDGDELRIGLPAAEVWERFACRVNVSTDEDLSALDRPRCHVIVVSRETATRLPFPLAELPGGGEVELLRDEVVRDLTMTVEVTAVHAGRRRVVGRSEAWTMVEHDHRAGIPDGVPVPTVWLDFASPEAPSIARRSPGAHAAMEYDGATPRLLLNSALPGFRDLLHADAARLERRRLRDLLASDVARLAVSTLLRAAVARIDVADDGTVLAPLEPLHRQVCASVAEAMAGMGSTEEFYEVAASARSGDAADFWSRVDLGIDELVGRRSAVTTACEEIRVV